MKRISFTSKNRDPDDTLHIETDLGIINIHVNLRDRLGRKVENISIIPDRYCGDQEVKVVPHRNLRLIQLKKIHR